MTVIAVMNYVIQEANFSPGNRKIGKLCMHKISIKIIINTKAIVTLICQLTGHCKTLMICELSLIWFTCIVQDLGWLKCYPVSVFAIMTFIVTFSAPIATVQQNFVWQAHFEIVTDLVFDIYCYFIG